MVDIILPVYNRLHPLDRAIASVFHQTRLHFILWVIDDGSSMDLSPVLQKWVPQFPKGQMQILKNNKNNGVSQARNKGILQGRGRWIAFLDSDDEWLNSKLQKQMKHAENHPEHKLIHTNEIWIRRGLRTNQKKIHKKKGGRIFSHNLPMCRISPSSCLIEREFLLKAGLFNESFPVCEDYELWLRLCLKTEVGFIEEPLVIKYGGHPDQLSRKYKAMDEWRVRAMSQHLNNPELQPFEKDMLVSELKKKCEILLKGYKKHKNFKNQEEILKIYNRLPLP